MHERLNKCPLCKSGHFLNYSTIKDWAVSKEEFILCECQDCKLIFTNPRPSEKQIGTYYEFPEYYSHQDESKGLIQRIYNQIRRINITKKYKLISSLGTDKSILDIGCGTGELLRYFQEKNWEVNGVEPNKKARSLAKEKLGENVYKSLKKVPENHSFDIISLFHVLEHVHDLRKSLKKIIKLLKSDGYIILALPNHQSKDAKKYKNFWAGWDVPRHLYHFDPESVRQLAKQFDLEIVNQKPMIFDSYYASLLSEKYQDPNSGNLKNLMQSFFEGMQSNQEAKKSGNYSSILYILSKK
ncbi:class I SAM-dependent methyltransferase [Algoriphagus kandeliae]|uniref:Class I SAM-dependent methyltransferase n=1 Tax=Algoriphagus kandeliae TaxID=2562278 RepID=A0A4Y9QXK5_9BACT|nr:class I SAM-dependent methyltransferase [Algoriphagus kandeliae]TFV95705.1 class I SAM-dependent methyltransferase [Algoriphagus kandeliae]